jgi:hypothetical protein
MLRPYPADEMEAFLVITVANSLRNNTPECGDDRISMSANQPHEYNEESEHAWRGKRLRSRLNLLAGRDECDACRSGYRAGRESAVAKVRQVDEK